MTSATTKTYRFQALFSRIEYEALCALANRLGASKSETLRRAVRLLDTASELREGNEMLALVVPNRGRMSVREVIPWDYFFNRSTIEPRKPKTDDEVQDDEQPQDNDP